MNFTLGLRLLMLGISAATLLVVAAIASISPKPMGWLEVAWLWWLVGGVPLLVGLLVPLVGWLERRLPPFLAQWAYRGVQGLAIAAWLLPVVIIPGRHGMSVAWATVVAAGLFGLAVAVWKHALRRAHRGHDLDTHLLFALVGGLVILGVVAWGSDWPGGRLVIVDWPCREEEWRAQALYEGTLKPGRLQLDERRLRRRQAAADRAEQAWRRCLKAQGQPEPVRLPGTGRALFGHGLRDEW